MTPFNLPLSIATNNTWTDVTLVIGHDEGGAAWPVTVVGVNATKTSAYGPFPSPVGTGKVSVTCGVSLPESPVVTLLDTVTLTTACK